jgi:hypothetical protein
MIQALPTAKRARQRAGGGAKLDFSESSDSTSSFSGRLVQCREHFALVRAASLA